MKKARIALTAICLFAIIGGALAFKALSPTYYYKQSTPGGACTVQTVIYYSIVPDSRYPGYIGIPVYLADKPGPCKKYIMLGTDATSSVL